MDRRLFLTGLLGLAGGAALLHVSRPSEAIAGVPHGNGILDEIDAAPATEIFEDDGSDAQVELIRHRRWHRHHRRRRRRVWRRYCRRYWHRGRWRTRCYRRLVWYWV